MQGYLLLGRQKQFSDSDTELLRHLSMSYGHAFNSFLKNISINNYFKKYFTGKKSWKIYLSIFIILFLPLRLSSTAPVEVVAKKPKLVTAPFDGVVKEIVVNNNDKVKFGDLLILLEDCLLYTSPSPRDGLLSRMPSSA